MNRREFRARLLRLVELSQRGLLAIFKRLPEHWDRRGITVKAVASSFEPARVPLFGDPKKGLPIGRGLRMLREPWRPGMLKTRRRFQVVTPDGTTIGTMSRGRGRTWHVQSIENTLRKSRIPTEKLAASYETMAQFRPDAAELRKMAKAYGVGKVTPALAGEKAGGIPMIRRPRA